MTVRETIPPAVSSNDERTPERPSSSTGSAQPPSKRQRPNEAAATPMSNSSLGFSEKCREIGIFNLKFKTRFGLFLLVTSGHFQANHE